ncbi:MAG TPA: hypothetical protein VLS89_01500 [Candidatus Nanopelagicales bacterium]|nr:hypothetical protein [Candidatus Nanopelagicales bacterium]
MANLDLRVPLLACLLGVTAAVGAAAAGACDGGGGGSGGAGGGMGGAGGCPIAPEALFTITVRAVDGLVPEDTTIRVTWSVGEEPLFELDDPGTWKTLDQANLVCDVDPAAPPEDLAELHCQIWSNGPTRVEVSADGYAPYDETLTPMMSELCEGPVPQEVRIELAREQDGGT